MVLCKSYLTVQVDIPGPGDVKRPGDACVEWQRSVDGI